VATIEQAKSGVESRSAGINQTFAVRAREAASDFRPLPKRVNRDGLLSFRHCHAEGHLLLFAGTTVRDDKTRCSESDI
jgi:hypothetical protein